LIAVCAPTGRIYFDFGHMRSPKLGCPWTNGFYYEWLVACETCAIIALRGGDNGAQEIFPHSVHFLNPCHCFAGRCGAGDQCCTGPDGAAHGPEEKASKGKA